MLQLNLVDIVLPRFLACYFMILNAAFVVLLSRNTWIPAGLFLCYSVYSCMVYYPFTTYFWSVRVKNGNPVGLELLALQKQGMGVRVQPLRKPRKNSKFVFINIGPTFKNSLPTFWIILLTILHYNVLRSNSLKNTYNVV